MRKWKDISLFQFQEINRLKSDSSLSEVDQTLFVVCTVYGMTPHELDYADARKATRLIASVSSILADDVPVKIPKKLNGYRIEYDLSKINFAQYVELSFYLAAPVVNAHNVIAALSYRPFLSRITNKKRGLGILSEKAEKILASKAYLTLGALKHIVDAFRDFNSRFPGLLGLNTETHGEHVTDPFNVRYGWTYAAQTIAEYERIPLQDAYRLDVVHAFSDLGFLKAKADYERNLYKKTVTNA